MRPLNTWSLRGTSVLTYVLRNLQNAKRLDVVRDCYIDNSLKRSAIWTQRCCQELDNNPKELAEFSPYGSKWHCTVSLLVPTHLTAITWRKGTVQHARYQCSVVPWVHYTICSSSMWPWGSQYQAVFVCTALYTKWSLQSPDLISWHWRRSPCNCQIPRPISWRAMICLWNEKALQINTSACHCRQSWGRKS